MPPATEFDPAVFLQPDVVAAYFDEEARRNMARVVASPEYFRSVLMIDKGLGNKGTLASSADPWQQADFEAMDPAWLSVAGRGTGRPKYLHAYLERARGHSKTTDIAATALWAMLSSRRKLRGLAASGSKEQAGFIRDGIDTLLRLNSWLGEVIRVNKWEVTNLRTGSELTILATNEGTTYGHTPDFAIVDELTHWTNEGFWTSLASSAGKRPGCVLHIISNAGVGRGKPLKEGDDPSDLGGSWQWRIREQFRISDEAYFHRLDGCVASWITEKQLAFQRKLLSDTAYSRLWLNEWQIDGASALPWDDIEACVVLPGPREDGSGLECCVGAIDLSQTKHYTALVIFGINLDRRRVELAFTKRWRPQDFPDKRISLRHVRAEIREYAQRFNLLGLAYDPHQAALLVEDLMVGEKGPRGEWKYPPLPCHQQNFTPKDKHAMATKALACFRERQVDLYRDQELLRDLTRMRLIEKTGKRLSIEAPEGDDVGHCDVGTAYVLGWPWAIGTLNTLLGVVE
jgi:hypothetical protein